MSAELLAAGFTLGTDAALAVLVPERERLLRNLEWGYFALLTLNRMPSWRDGLIVAELDGELPALVWKSRNDPDSHALAVRDGIPYLLSNGHWTRRKMVPLANIARACRVAGVMIAPRRKVLP